MFQKIEHSLNISSFKMHFFCEYFSQNYSANISHRIILRRLSLATITINVHVGHASAFSILRFRPVRLSGTKCFEAELVTPHFPLFDFLFLRVSSSPCPSPIFPRRPDDFPFSFFFLELCVGSFCVIRSPGNSSSSYRGKLAASFLPFSELVTSGLK